MKGLKQLLAQVWTGTQEKTVASSTKPMEAVTTTTEPGKTEKPNTGMKKQRKRGSKRTVGKRTSEELAAYKHWRYLKQKRLKAEGKLPKDKKKKSVPNTDYSYYWQAVKNSKSYIETFRRRRRNAIYYGKIFTNYYNRLYNVINRYGTPEEKAEFEKLSNEEI